MGFLYTSNSSLPLLFIIRSEMAVIRFYGRLDFWVYSKHVVDVSHILRVNPFPSMNDSIYTMNISVMSEDGGFPIATPMWFSGISH